VFAPLRDLISAAGGRRFILTAGAGIVHTALFAVKVLSEQGYITLTLATVGVYISASTYQKVKELRSE
jgi:hypothetical protein